MLAGSGKTELGPKLIRLVLLGNSQLRKLIKPRGDRPSRISRGMGKVEP